MTPETGSAPLEDMTVLDLSQGIAGPYCTHLLAVQGAQVVKIEPPAGDWGRSIGTGRDGQTALSVGVNGNKQSLCLDAATPEGRAALHRLARSSDVIVESFRPGVAARLGLDPVELEASRPGQIFVSISGFGPDVRRPGSDTVIQAMSGMMALNAAPDGTPRLVPMYVVDTVTALYAAQLVGMALVERTRTGRGRHLQVSLLEAAAAFQAVPALEQALAERCPPGRQAVPSGVFRAADGFVRITSLTQATFVALCEGLGHPEWPGTPAFADATARAANADALNDRIAAVVANETQAEWLARLEPRGVLIAPVNDYAAFRADPQVQRSGLFAEVDQPGLGPVPLARQPCAARDPGPSPALGADGHGVLIGAGFTPEEVAALVKAGAVTLPDPS